jgi:hypothetical protein
MRVVAEALAFAGANRDGTHNPGSLTRLGGRSSNSVCDEVLATRGGREYTMSTAMQPNRPPMEILIGAGSPAQAERPPRMPQGAGARRSARSNFPAPLPS